ncbi:LysR substrate-binding domain-containing protein [Streptomyces kunmingensis]|uniref:LysR substrate-binding domain-containing protein n=1 Tax=Streptomyces kunmingensis TaxID=68225 RepID=A0ABU6CIA8_9ACTN|nr:LysR substrate-binding domain-containing protein [Streptomyces kunmingensis]MEB3964448.1 LysR substrate-binding domain-containing protein [Streptomyces kunmingensis]
MELRHLRYFVAVAEERHFGRAAVRLHVTQSTLSTQVQALEKEVGGPLFRRTSRRVELTEAGELMLTHARVTLAQADHTVQVARRSIEGKTGLVRIGFSGVAVLQGVLTADMHAFRRTHPGTELCLTEIPPAEQVKAVREGTLDVGYCPRLGLGDTDGLTLRSRAATTLSVALRQDHELAAAATISVAELARWDLVVYATEDEEAQVLAQLGPAVGHPRSRVHPVTGTLGALAFAAAGVGVAVVPTSTTRIDLPDLTYRPLDDASGPDLLVVSRSDELSGAVRAFLDRSWG